MVTVSGRPGFTVRNVAGAKGGAGQVCARLRGLELCPEGRRSPDRMHHLSIPGWMLRVQPTVVGKIRLADHVTQGRPSMDENPRDTPSEDM